MSLTSGTTSEQSSLVNLADVGGERRPPRKAFSLDASDHSYSLDPGRNGRGPEDAPTRQARPFFAALSTDAVVQSPVSESIADASATQLQTNGASDHSQTQHDAIDQGMITAKTEPEPKSNGLISFDTTTQECLLSPEKAHDDDREAGLGSEDGDSGSQGDDVDSTDWLSDSSSINGGLTVSGDRSGLKGDSQWISFPNPPAQALNGECFNPARC